MRNKIGDELEEETERRWEEMLDSVHYPVTFTATDVHELLWDGDNGIGWHGNIDNIYLAAKGANAIHGGGGLNLDWILGKDIKHLGAGIDEEYARNLLESGSTEEGFTAEDVEAAKQLLRGEVEPEVMDTMEDLTESAHRGKFSERLWEESIAGKWIDPPTGGTREAFKADFFAAAEMWKSFKPLPLLYEHAYERTDISIDDKETASQNAEIVAAKAEEMFAWNEKINRFIRSYADFLQTRLGEFIDEFEQSELPFIHDIDNMHGNGHYELFDAPSPEYFGSREPFATPGTYQKRLIYDFSEKGHTSISRLNSPEDHRIRDKSDISHVPTEEDEFGSQRVTRNKLVSETRPEDWAVPVSPDSELAMFTDVDGNKYTEYPVYREARM